MATAYKDNLIVRLNLSHKEAQLLIQLVGNVCGSEDGVRRHADAIYGALNTAGVYVDHDYREVHFKELDIQTTDATEASCRSAA